MYLRRDCGCVAYHGGRTCVGAAAGAKVARADVALQASAGGSRPSVLPVPTLRLPGLQQRPAHVRPGHDTLDADRRNPDWLRVRLVPAHLAMC